MSADILGAALRGGIDSNEQDQTMDFQENYLKAVLGFLGIRDVRFIREEAVTMGDDACQHARDVTNAANV